MRRVATLWKVIEMVLKQHASPILEALRPPARAGEITALEDALGLKLPAALVSSLKIHDGMDEEETFIGYRSLLSVKEIEAWWRLTLSVPWDEPGPRFAHARRIKGDLRWREKWVPVMGFNGDLTVLDLDPGPAGKHGQLFPWYNNGATPMRVVADSYAAWLDAVAEELGSDRFRIDELRTIHTRKRLA
jgi:cell wall assembly regulator SMI1